MTAASRAILSTILGIQNSANPTTANLGLWNYTGYDYYVRKIIRDKTNTPILNNTNATNILRMPTISTMACQALPNANHNGYTHSANNEDRGAGVNGANVNLGPITFEGADIIWEYTGEAGAGITANERALTNDKSPVAGLNNNSFDGKKIRLVFKLSSFGKRLRKILIGLGYDVNLSNEDKVSILPLVAFYKAWWDTYAPERERNFYETACWKMINDTILNATSTNIINVLNTSGGAGLQAHFVQFMVDLGTCFATEKIDAISAATENILSQGISQQTHNVAIYDTINEILQMTNSIENDTNNGSNNTKLQATQISRAGAADPDFAPVPVIQFAADPNHVGHQLTNTQINALKKAYIMINKSSVAGMKVEEILRMNGFGDYVEECKGKFINSSDDAIKISDVVATAATSEAKLGQYGGRGIGVGNFQFSFSTNRHGYLIILSSIVPESGYINAPTHENEAISFETMYNPEFDGLTYEAIQKKNLVGSPLINDASYADTFGFLPTYSQWKFMTNKANGDFSLNSMKTSLTPYTLDKYIPVADANVYASHVITGGTNDGTTEIDCAPSFKYSDLPNAGEDYRFVNKFPWNGNYNRIFAADDDGYEWSVFSQNNNQFLFNSFEYDNFLVHNVFDIAYWAHMKSIEDSYGTYDEEHGAPNSTVTRS